LSGQRAGTCTVAECANRRWTRRVGLVALAADSVRLFGCRDGAGTSLPLLLRGNGERYRGLSPRRGVLPLPGDLAAREGKIRILVLLLDSGSTAGMDSPFSNGIMVLGDR